MKHPRRFYDPPGDSARDALRALLSVGHTCNNRCRGCEHLFDARTGDLSSDIIIRRIEQLRTAGVSTIVLTGGEPTISPGFFSLSASIQHHGLGFGLITNGRMFSYRVFANRFIDCDPVCTQISIFAHDPEIHDFMAGVPGAFAQTLAGIRNVAGKLENLTICVPVSQVNAKFIMNIPDIVWGLGFKGRLKFTVSGCRSLYANRAPEWLAHSPEMGATISQAISYGLGRYAHRGLTFCWEGLAPCHIPEFPDYGTDPLLEDVGLVWDFPDEHFRFPHDPIVSGDHFEECIICSHRMNCQSMDRSIRRPFLQRVPNAVGYDYHKALEADGDADCPAGNDACAGLHSLCDVAVLNDGAFDLYRTEARISGYAMQHVKFVREQIYLNISGRTRGLDFRTAFQRLVLHDKCRACAKLPMRSGVFTPLRGNAFSGIEKIEMDWLEGIRGRVLDIGCGKPLFPDILLSRVASGEIDYLGVDPDPECPDALKIAPMDFEHFSWDGPAFDHIMMLRSYNHFKDPRLVLKKASELLKTGGQLHIFENGLFAMLKKNVPDESADGHKSPFQHFRNHFSEDTLNLISHAGDFEMIHHSSVTPQCANQWFLTLRKMSGRSDIPYDSGGRENQ